MTKLGLNMQDRNLTCSMSVHYITQKHESPIIPTRTAESSRLQKQRSTQSTAHSHSNVKCNPSVTVTESSPWRWPSRVETCRSVLRLMIKLFVHLLVISVFVRRTEADKVVTNYIQRTLTKFQLKIGTLPNWIKYVSIRGTVINLPYSYICYEVQRAVQVILTINIWLTMRYNSFMEKKNICVSSTG
jgi:hypothetical protein